MSSCIVWLRRDLRIKDHHALSLATRNFDKVYLLFVFDRNILDKLDQQADHRVLFIFQALKRIEEQLGIAIIKVRGEPATLVPDIAQKLKVDAVLTNRDYEAYAKRRDQKVAQALQAAGIDFTTHKDTVILEFDELTNKTGGFYKVFTPFKNAWFERLNESPELMAEFKVNVRKIVTASPGIKLVTSLEEIGFSAEVAKEKYRDPDPKKLMTAFKRIAPRYNEVRDFPALDQTSHLSVHLRFGTISVRSLVGAHFAAGSDGEKVWLSELAWRDFYFGILDKNPRIEGEAYIEKFKHIPWPNDRRLFKAWCQGRTGVPIVDASMRQLNQTGWMHNRCRMIVASYLVKTLLVDWRWGEEYFAKQLIDFDLAANNGGWQWAASTGCDSVPYFRVFNPYRQSARFDPNGEFIRKYCPELAEVPSKLLHRSNGNEVVSYQANRIKVLSLFKRAGDQRP